MADQAGLSVPYHDPYDGPYNDDILNLMDDNIPFLADLAPLFDGPSFHPHSVRLFNDFGVQEAEHPSQWDSRNNGPGGGVNSEAGPSGIGCEMGNPPGANLETPNACDDYACTKPLSVWPVPPLPFNCSCCQVLREIIHINGSIYYLHVFYIYFSWKIKKS